jgi:hypothetical protein
MSDTEDPAHQKDQLRNWLLSLIDTFREEYQKLSDEERSSISNADDYSPPCQLEVFWVNEPVEFQILVLTHDHDRPDREIVINGPYKSYGFITEVEKVMQEERWRKKVPRSWGRLASFEATYSDEFAMILGSFINDIKRSVFYETEPDKPVRWTGIIFVNGFCRLFKGNMVHLDYRELALEGMKRAERGLPNKKKPDVLEESDSKSTEIHGFGGFFYPPIWVGKPRKPSFREILGGTIYPSPYECSPVIKSRIGQNSVIIYENGFVFVDADNKTDAVKLLNTIFGVSLLYGLETYALRESEIIELDIYPETFRIGSLSYQITQRTELMDPALRERLMLHDIKEVEKETLTEIVNAAGRVLGNTELREMISFLLESYTHHVNSEYSQAYIMSWLVIERHLSKLWRKVFEGTNKSISKKRSDKLSNWSMDYVLEVLNLFDAISDKDFNTLMELKGQRNKFVHDGKRISEGYSEKILEFCLGILKGEISKFS